MRNEHRSCGTCRHHKRIRIRRNGVPERVWICDGDLSEREGTETGYDDVCDAWERRED